MRKSQWSRRFQVCLANLSLSSVVRYNLTKVLGGQTMSVVTTLSGLLLFLNFQSTPIHAGAQKPLVNRLCFFSNPAYAGVCVITPAKDEPCEDILKYLNSPMSAGKTYCASTSIRGGWKRERSQKPGARSQNLEAGKKKSKNKK